MKIRQRPPPPHFQKAIIKNINMNNQTQKVHGRTKQPLVSFRSLKYIIKKNTLNVSNRSSNSQAQII